MQIKKDHFRSNKILYNKKINKTNKIKANNTETAQKITISSI